VKKRLGGVSYFLSPWLDCGGHISTRLRSDGRRLAWWMNLGVTPSVGCEPRCPEEEVGGQTSGPAKKSLNRRGLRHSDAAPGRRCDGLVEDNGVSGGAMLTRNMHFTPASAQCSSRRAHRSSPEVQCSSGRGALRANPRELRLSGRATSRPPACTAPLRACNFARPACTCT